MSSDRWRTIEELFHAALQRPPEERSAYLDKFCDPGIRREVESLLDETADIDRFMERPVGGLSLSALDAEPSLEGRSLNHYRIGPVVGRGGMAEVYRAHDTRLERDVAIKFLHNASFVDRARLAEMYREARLLASLNHPNIASIYGIEEADGLCGIVLELIEGESLSDRIKLGPVSIGESLHFARQIVAGLQAAHAKGIIHRDLKPSNIKITTERMIKIVDFGLARLLDYSFSGEEGSPDVSRRSVIVGTLAFMSPEQARGKPVDARTDIWAFGCVLYEMLAGKAAFRGESPTDTIVKIATEDPDWTLLPTLPPAVAGVEQIIRRCIQKNPAFRYQSVQEIVTALDGMQEQKAVAAQPPSVSQPSAADEDFVLPVRSAPTLFMLAQVGYLALYAAAMYHIDAIAQILGEDFQVPDPAGFIGTIVLAMCGIAVRLYLITAVGWRHPAAGRKFDLLFPVLLVLDSIWSASPLLLRRHLGTGLALGCVALLAYVPFAERTLMRTIYPKRVVRTGTPR